MTILRKSQSYLLFLTVIFLLVRSENASISNSTEALTYTNKSLIDTDLPQKVNDEISSNPLQTIDLTTCKCLPKDEYCQIAIAKSIVMEISCAEDLNYCCNTTLTGDQKDIQELKNTKGPKVNIYFPTPIEPESKLKGEPSLPPTPNPSSSNYNLKGDANTNGTVTITNGKQKPKCRCKPRSKCQPKYVDYRFGFDCSYSTVRCCEPESQILREQEEALQESGKVIFPANKQAQEIANSPHELSPTYKTPEDCFCLPISRCKIDPNTISKRKDTLCPYDLVQCCGESINEEKDNNVTNVETTNPISPEGSLSEPESRVGTTAETGVGVNMHGQPAYWQPVQLPLMKIPLRGEESQTEEVKTTTMSPPQLPTHYYYQPPNYNVDYYRPTSYSQYSNNPWSGLTHAVPYNHNQYSSRYHQIGGQNVGQHAVQYESARSNEESPTLLKTIANFLG